MAHKVQAYMTQKQYSLFAMKSRMH
jgi:hypothetical protein